MMKQVISSLYFHVYIGTIDATFELVSVVSRNSRLQDVVVNNLSLVGFY